MEVKHTADSLCKLLGISRRKLFNLKKLEGAPKSFDNVEDWTAFIGQNTTYVKPDVKNPTVTESNVIYFAARAKEKVALAEQEVIILESTKRNTVPKGDVIALFTKLATVLKGRLGVLKHDLPCALVGLDAPAMEKIIEDKIDGCMAPFDIPKEFWLPKSKV
jgi:hypothetical protein